MCSGETQSLVYAPPIYLSFAWTISKQAHPYAHGVSLLTLALFALHLVYASNHRRSILQGFALARRSADLARELGHHLVDRHVQGRVIFGLTGNNEWCTSFINQN